MCAMSDSKIIEESERFDIVTIYFKNRDGFVPISCPVCSFLMRGSSDSESYFKFKCCFDCDMKWAQSRKKDWEDGWRPTDDEIKQEISQRKKIPPAFHL
jgi:hypothetical protein